MEASDQSTGGSRPALASGPPPRRTAREAARAADSFGLVLLLVVLDYVAVATSSGTAWGSVAIVALHGLTLLFALRTSRARRVWVFLAGIFLVAGTALTALAALHVLSSDDRRYDQAIAAIGGVLLLATPVAIVRRVVTHRVVTAETLLGAMCVYVLLGFSFASVFAAIGLFSPVPFFTGVQHATGSTYLFFSYTTLTTVGYGNLVPASTWGQTLAMLEAMLGQVYLVLGVARLVSLWGQAIPRNARPPDTGTDDA